MSNLQWYMRRRRNQAIINNALNNNPNLENILNIQNPIIKYSLPIIAGIGAAASTYYITGQNEYSTIISALVGFSVFSSTYPTHNNNSNSQ